MDRITNNEINTVASLTPMLSDVWQPIQAITKLMEILLGWLSVSLEIFIRHSFGERALSPIRLFLGFMAMQLFTLIPTLIYNMIPFQSTYHIPVSRYLIYAYLIAALVHRFAIWRRSRSGIQWHSRSFGISLFSFLPVDDWTLYRWIEPAICLGISVFLRPIMPITASWLMMASLALFMKNQMVFYTEKGRILDLLDAQIEGAYITDAIAGKPKQETAGFSVAIPKAPIFSEAVSNMAATDAATI